MAGKKTVKLWSNSVKFWTESSSLDKRRQGRKYFRMEIGKETEKFPKMPSPAPGAHSLHIYMPNSTSVPGPEIPALDFSRNALRYPL
jgi:hypothetical protein